jgi:hypothetical protein
MSRKTLPLRRHCETFDIGYNSTQYTISVGLYENQEVAEVFITGAKAGSEFEAVARDAAVVLSIALQYGVPVHVLAHSITRNIDETPRTIMGAVLDELVRRQKQ